MSKVLLENITGVRVIRAFNKEAHEEQRLCDEFKSYAKTAIIGGTGSGKSTVASLMMRFNNSTVLDNESGNLSIGQRQLITIARVFLCSPPIIILDEATSSVDTRTEMEISRAMKKLMHGRTSFVIAHRLSTIRDADTILFMENGNITEQGSHKELLEKNGAYSTLYFSQFA